MRHVAGSEHGGLPDRRFGWLVVLLSLVACHDPSTSQTALRSAEPLGSSSVVSPIASSSTGPIAATSSAPASSSVPQVDGHLGNTEVIPKPIADAMIGCWKPADSDEHWRMTRGADDAIDVVREIAAPDRDSDYGRRAHIPRKLMYDAAKESFGFSAAGPIHALLFVFTKTGDELRVDSYSSRVPSEGYHWTGNHFVVRRCPAGTKP